MKVKTVDSITDALRDALTDYYKSNTQNRIMIAQQLFGVATAKLLLPNLNEIAENVRPRMK